MAIHFSCACRFNRDTEFSEATQVEECAFHAARRAEEVDTEHYKAAVLLRAVRDQWYRFTGYSQLKVDIDELLERLDMNKEKR